MSKEQALIAVRRLGLGARPGDLARVAGDPRGYVLNALRDRDAALVTGSDLRTSAENYAAIVGSFARVKQERRQVAANGRTGSGASMSDGMMGGGRGKSPPAQREFRRLRRGVGRAELRARMSRAITTDAPFVERWVMFWSNHFCVSAGKGSAVFSMAGAYEREVIRPHALGRFSDMLRAAEQHPAMLSYLDNLRSFGPNSRVGRKRGKGLNENLAREILELHTLGVDGGYTQQDVTSFARILTGWAMAYRNSRRAEPGTFIFRRGIHEPGDQVVLGKRYRDQGVRTGERVLDDLARHPATARFIARKLARHFVSDNPPPTLVAKLERTFRKTDGDLRELAVTLARADEVWQAPPTKILPPYDFSVAMMRGLGVTSPPLRPRHLFKRLGQPLWQPQSPKGWPDGDNDWAGPSAIRERLRIASRVARLVRRDLSPPAVADDILGPGLSAYARQAIERAQSPAQGFELLIMSPAFQRR